MSVMTSLVPRPPGSGCESEAATQDARRTVVAVCGKGHRRIRARGESVRLKNLCLNADPPAGARPCELMCRPEH